MATFDYNPITGQLDLVGSGGGTSYINGVVADPTALPVTLGTPPLDSVYLAKAGSGVWLINRRPAGLYVRVANNGVAADWTYLGAFPEVNSSANWELYDGTDPTKELKFDLSGISTATTRTLTAPNASGRIQIEGQPIGNTTPAAGTFTTLTANNGTLTASAPVLTLAQSWNNAAVTFTGLQLAVTNTASAAASRIMDLQVDGTTQFAVRRGSSSTAAYAAPSQIEWYLGTQATPITFDGTGTPAPSIIAPQLIANTDLNITAGRFGSGNLFLRSQSNLVEIRGVTATSAQELRINNTFTSATNHERGFLRWSSNVFQIGTEKGSGGGTARNLEIQTDGITRISWSGAVGNTAIGVGLALIFNERVRLIPSGGDGILRLTNIGDSGFDRLQFGGTTSSFPALKRSSTALQVRLADDSGDAPLSSGAITTSGTVTANNTSSGFVTSSAPNGATPVRFAANSGDVLIQSGNAVGIVEFRGTTGTNPQSLRVFNSFTSSTNFERLNIRWASNECIIDAEAGSGGGTLRGIKIGSATSSLLGFYGATPVAQQAAVADSTDTTNVATQLNALLARLRTLGLIAT